MGNFSRNTFNRLKHYVGVRLQQGVPIVDADWNELEDIRKYELHTFLRRFVGNGVPRGNDGFAVFAVAETNDFGIRGGDGTADGAGRCLVEGWEVVNESDLPFSKQPLYNNATLAAKWGVDPVQPLTTPASNRIDLVYLDVWEREVDSTEEPDHLVNPAIGVETAVRLKREWAVRVVEGTTTLPSAPRGHVFYSLASLRRTGGSPTISAITDRRQTGINLATLETKVAALQSEISDARGSQRTLAQRLEGALTTSGQIQPNVVGIANLSNYSVETWSSIEFQANETKDFPATTWAPGQEPAHKLTSLRITNIAFPAGTAPSYCNLTVEEHCVYYPVSASNPNANFALQYRLTNPMSHTLTLSIAIYRAW